MIYHIFMFRINGRWYRDSDTYSDQEFSRIMDRLKWKLPYNIEVFHYGLPDSHCCTLTNRVVLERPILSLDIRALAEAKPVLRTILCDKLRQREFHISGQLGRFVLTSDNEGNCWPRFYYVDGVATRLRTELQIVPLTFREAKNYVDRYHRHNAAPQGHKFSVGLRAPGEDHCIGVAIASIPKARGQDDGLTLEVNRVCCDPCYANACSKLYSSVLQSGRAMGYRRFITYTLPEESGSSIRAVGFHLDGVVPSSPKGWDTRSRHRIVPSRYPKGQKLRWVLDLQ